MSNKLKVVFFEVSEAEKADLMKMSAESKELSNASVQFIAEKLTKENLNLAQGADVISVFINSVVSKEIIDQLPNLKFIVTRSTGFDHIDSAYAATKGIKVSNVPAYGSRTVAEYTFALILGLSRKTLDASYQIKSGQNPNIANFIGFDLQGKTLGIVGTGKIGLNVAKIAKGFDMNVLAFDAFPNEAQAQTLEFKYVTLDELLAQADIVTLHVPYNAQTKHLINKDNIKKFKPGALLVNTARGEICSTEALLIGIQEKILAGVALDVIEGERKLKEEGTFFAKDDQLDLNGEQTKTLLESHILINSPEVFITPHIAFFTKEAEREIVSTAVLNIESFIKGENKNLVGISS